MKLAERLSLEGPTWVNSDGFYFYLRVPTDGEWLAQRAFYCVDKWADGATPKLIDIGNPEKRQFYDVTEDPSGDKEARLLWAAYHALYWVADTVNYWKPACAHHKPHAKINMSGVLDKVVGKVQQL